MTTQELRDKRGIEVSAMQGIVKAAEAEDRPLNETEQDTFDGHETAIGSIDGRLKVLASIDAVDTADDAPRPKASRGGAVHADSDIHVGPDNVLADPSRGFKSAGDFYRVAYAAFNGGGVPDRLRPLAAATGMSQTVGADGGFAIPPSFSTTIWDGLNNEADSLFAATDQYDVEGESLTFNANAETSRATGSRYGGVNGYWINEADQITSSIPKLRQLKLEPHEIAVLIYQTDKLIKNSGNALGQFLSRAATEEIVFLTNDAIVNGSGAGKPVGLLKGTAGTSSPRVAVAKETGQSAATVVHANIVKMFSRMHHRARNAPGTAWYINQDIEPQLHTMTLSVGASGLPSYMPPGGLSGAPYATLMGKPVIPIEYCATLGTEGDIILANLGYYATGTQGGVESAVSMHLRFDYKETAFRFCFAVDGQPWMLLPLTPFKGSNTLSPFVTLATRA